MTIERIDERAVMHDAANSKEYYYYPRELWTVEGLVNNRGHEVEHYTYDAYGLPVIKAVRIHDVNYDGVINPTDSGLVMAAYGQNPGTAGPILDIDGNGVINPADSGLVMSLYGQPVLVTLTTSALHNPYMFTGQWYDGDGRYHYRRRAYDSIHARFGQRDPADYVDGMNLYEYVRSNPLRWGDPRGLWRKDRRKHDIYYPDDGDNLSKLILQLEKDFGIDLDPAKDWACLWPVLIEARGPIPNEIKKKMEKKYNEKKHNFKPKGSGCDLAFDVSNFLLNVKGSSLLVNIVQDCGVLQGNFNLQASNVSDTLKQLKSLRYIGYIGTGTI